MDIQGDEDMVQEAAAVQRAVQADRDAGFEESRGRRLIDAVVFVLGMGCGGLITVTLIASRAAELCQ